jgi:hypothetical protein
MLMKVFPHGQGAGDKPTRYLLRPDYPGREEAPPEVLRGDPSMTRALIDSVDRRWKFTSGVLSWHPDDTVSAEQEEEVMDAFERVAFAGLEPDQRNILWVRHQHSGHHELHFLIPRVELSSGKDFNACPPGWHKDFDVFRDLFNWREGWARPDDPRRAREDLPKKADLFKARMARWGKEIKESERDKAKDAVHAHLKMLIAHGAVQDRAGILEALNDLGLSLNRAGKDYISVKDPESGMKMRFKGGIYAEGWRPHEEPEIEETAEEQRETARRNVIRLQLQLEAIVAKRAACNKKRYPVKWAHIEQEDLLILPQIQEDIHHDRDRKDADPDFEATGRQLQRPDAGFQQETGDAGRKPNAFADGVARVAALIQRCKRGIHELADLVGQIEKRRVEREQEQQIQAPRMRMR